MISLNDVLLAMSNVPVDDPIAEIWGRGLQGGHEIIEYTGTLPITINADGNALIDYCIYGNTVQNGTPTPENPIMPVGVGERTENLCDENNINQGYYAYADGQYGNIGTWVNTYYIAIKGNTEYTAEFETIYGVSRWYGFVWYDKDKQYISSTNSGEYPKGCKLTAISPANASFCVFDICTIDTSSPLSPPDVIYCMLNEGSTALPYEPYGYKLPMTVSNGNAVQTVPVYIGEAETTRRIKKLVLDGTEPWYASSNTGVYYTNKSASLNPIHSLGVCTRFVYHFVNSVSNLAHGEYLIDQINKFTWFRNNDIANSQAWKAWLAQQYAAGTPVTIWYVLAEPETGIVNEPLMKIGDYADTLSMEQASVSIPTFAGTTVIDYDGTPKPSEMYIKYRR